MRGAVWRGVDGRAAAWAGRRGVLSGAVENPENVEANRSGDGGGVWGQLDGGGGDGEGG